MNHKNLQIEFKKVSKLLIALGDENRQIIILRLLDELTCDGIQVGELMKDTKLSRPAVSHHLKVLKDADIVNFRSIGTRNFYYLNHNTNQFLDLKELSEAVIEIMEGIRK